MGFAFKVGASQVPSDPSTPKSAVTLDRRLRNTKRRRDLVDFKAAKIAEFHDASHTLVLIGEVQESLVDRHDFVMGHRSATTPMVQGNVDPGSALSQFSPGMIDQCTAKVLGGDRQKMGPIVERGRAFDEAKV